MLGDAASALLSGVCAHLPRVHVLRAGGRRGGLDGFRRRVCEGDCLTNVGSSEPNAHRCPRHLQTRFYLAEVKRGWLGSACLPLLPRSPELEDGVTTDVLPKHGLFFRFVDSMPRQTEVLHKETVF